MVSSSNPMDLSNLLSTSSTHFGFPSNCSKNRLPFRSHRESRQEEWCGASSESSALSTPSGSDSESSPLPAFRQPIQPSVSEYYRTITASASPYRSGASSPRCREEEFSQDNPPRPRLSHSTQAAWNPTRNLPPPTLNNRQHRNQFPYHIVPSPQQDAYQNNFASHSSSRHGVQRRSLSLSRRRARRSSPTWTISFNDLHRSLTVNELDRRNSIPTYFDGGNTGQAAYDHHPPQPRLQLQGRSRGPNSNKPYTEEQAFFIRYNKEDRLFKWDDVRISFIKKWPDEHRGEDGKNQGFQGCYYRSNWLPCVGRDWQLKKGADGKVLSFRAKIRERNTPVHNGAPTTLVEKYPGAIVSGKCPWVSNEDFQRASAILRQDEEDMARGTLSLKGKWRIAIAQAHASPRVLLPDKTDLSFCRNQFDMN